MNKDIQIEEEIKDQSFDLNSIESFDKYLENINPKKLELMITKLNFLCLNFDPYTQEAQDNIEIENIINEYKLMPYTSNPFDFTNKVLQILDKTQNKIKSRVQ